MSLCEMLLLLLNWSYCRISLVLWTIITGVNNWDGNYSSFLNPKTILKHHNNVGFRQFIHNNPTLTIIQYFSITTLQLIISKAQNTNNGIITQKSKLPMVVGGWRSKN